MHSHEELTTQPLFLSQGTPPLQITPLEHPTDCTPKSSTRRHTTVTTAPPVLQNPTQVGRMMRRSQCLARAYDPIHGQVNKGHTRGASNYKPRELQVLLDLVEEELPIASKGWKVVGSMF